AAALFSATVQTPCTGIVPQPSLMLEFTLPTMIVKQTLNLHGHIHNNSVNIAENINVGVDAPERDLLVPHLPFGTPLTAAEIHEIYRLKVAVLSKER
ncbi:hypothetical protein KW817_23340, partial [Enterobacter quasiroggenkampii]|uniref:hypothetical protein n=1 Tax=Enterobacter quasiroggenkampii TaxID=2497436 RepID=UPI0030B96527|nr:hypothetical protein [Enterobacter quasiroggenkampii]